MTAKSYYNMVRSDFEELEKIKELDDQVTLDAERLALMRNPSTRFAADLYYRAISLWIGEHGYALRGHPFVKATALRYLIVIRKKD